MSKFILLSGLILFSIISNAQVVDTDIIDADILNNCYDDYISRGLALVENKPTIDSKTYREALMDFKVALDCAKTDDEEIRAQKWINNANDGLLLALEMERDVAIQLRAENDRIINALYFYAGSYALAYNGEKYGFINKKGEVLIDYQFDEASNFDRRSGLAKVRKGNNFYILDTIGTVLLLVKYEESITKQTKAFEVSRGITYEKLDTIFKENNQLQFLTLESKYQNWILPESICDLSNLKYLDLNSCGLMDLPGNIGNLFSLEYLNISYNNIMELPWKIGELINLKSLVIHEGISSEIFEESTPIPNEIGNLFSLEYLDLSSNGLNYIPTTIGSLANLKYLNLNNNQLVVLPESVGDLTSLEELYLSNNSDIILPQSLSNLKNLKVLFIYGAEIPQEEIEALEKTMPWCEFKY